MQSSAVVVISLSMGSNPTVTATRKYLISATFQVALFGSCEQNVNKFCSRIVHA